MARFILRRLVRALVTLILFQTILFLLIQAIPGDFVSTLLGIPSGLRQAMRRVMGLNALFTLMAVVHPVLMATVWQRVTYHPMVGFDYGPHPLPHSVTCCTDSLGRDVPSQLLYGARTSFGLGLTGGRDCGKHRYGDRGRHCYGGWLDAILMRLSDTFVLLPPVILLIVGLLIVDVQWPQLALLYGLFAGLGSPAIVMKAQAMSVRTRQYIEAARVAGGGSLQVIWRHVLPHVLPISLLFLMFTASGSVLTEALLSFFGRTQIRLSWGTMIWFGQVTFRWSAAGEQWHVILPPALAITLFCGAFYMVGQAVEEVFHPHRHGRVALWPG